MNRKIVGLIGGIGSGKSSAAHHLTHQHRFVEVSIADAMKRFIRDLYGLPDEAVFGTQEQKAAARDELGGVSSRTALEHTAKFLRSFNENVLIDHAVRTSDAHRLVFPDVRYPNEFEWIKRNGGVIILMHVLFERPPSTGHESDEHWRNMEWDQRVNAERGDMTSVYNQLDAIVREITR